MCLNKVPVKDKETNTIRFYPCGKCYECVNRKTKRYVNMCNNEYELTKHCLFATLTYAPEHLPYCSIVVSKGIEYGTYNVSYVSLCDRMTEYYQTDIIHETIYNSKELLDKALLPLSFNKFNIGKDNVPVLFRHDVKLFMKRLRERLSEYLSKSLYSKSFKSLNHEQKSFVTKKVSELRTYICGEFGPVHFRPHYHLLLYFNSPELLPLIQNLVREVWKYGRTDVQPATTDAGQYVSGYVNSLVSIPPLLQAKPFRPFSQHSLFFGVNAPKEFSKKIQEITFESLKKRCIVTDGKFQPYEIPFSLENYLFPKTYRFNKSTDYELFKFYGLYPTFCKFFGTTKVKELVSMYFEHFNIELPFENKYDLIKNNYRPEQILYMSDNEETTLTRLLYVSKKFHRNCKYYNITPREYFNLIKTYYNEKNTFANQTFYKNLEIDSTLLDDYKYLCMYYDNIVPDIKYYFPHNTDSLTKLNRDIQYRTLEYFCTSINDILKPSHLFKCKLNPTDSSFFSDKYYMQEKISKDSIKHKFQNDLNEIFL